ncbi:GUN4 domain-containing protein [Leptolyngbya sp. FACHB-261]|uniref:GUN4 domain-containing protein n=1 Tax=Leptolyngbya sp. FACHB-261 TaxID=2692806 RepID=UPI0016893AF2|nr:GUN4 domain-containing protein [Leptolyngbya sp. FACHB-261]MBD2103822.1 GUN4 domain-containing protein [Leptolyngbya sp. FACHB-261]
MNHPQVPGSSEPSPDDQQQAIQIQNLQEQLSLLRRTNECLCRDNADLKRGRDALIARLTLLENALRDRNGDSNEAQSDPFPESDRWLLSTSQANYAVLKDLLALQAWDEADCETQQLMLQVAGSEAQELGFLTAEHIDAFPCLDLKIINKLWTIYSNGRYGFMVQREIWSRTHSTRNLWCDPELEGYYPKREGLGSSLAKRLLRCALDDF